MPQTPIRPSLVQPLRGLASFALLAACAAPAQAGPFEDAFTPVWPAADRAAECIDPEASRCPDPCPEPSACVAAAWQAVEPVADGARPTADGTVAAACALAACDAATEALLAAAASAPGTVMDAVSGAADAASASVDEARSEAASAVGGALDAARGLPSTLDRSVPTYVTVTCRSLAPAVSDVTCGVWIDRAPFADRVPQVVS